MARLQTLFCFLAAVSVTMRLTEAAVDCSGGGGTKCESCSTLALCNSGSVTGSFACQSDELCEEGDDGVGTCKLISDTSRTQCACSTYPSYVVDSYDDQKYLLCFADTMVFSLTCDDGQIFDGSSCVDAPETTATTVLTTSSEMTTTPFVVTCEEAGLFPVLPSCSGYYACISVGGSLLGTDVVSCESATPVYDPLVPGCVASIEEPAEPTCTSSDFVVADTVECNAFYVCSGGSLSGEKICCGVGEVFDASVPGCVTDDGSVTCPVVNPCSTAETEKTCVPPTC